ILHKIIHINEMISYQDISHQLDVIEIQKQLNKEHRMNILMVLNDINQDAKYSDRLVVMKNGSIRYDGIPQCVLCREMFQSVYHIDAKIHEQDEGTFLTPLKLQKEAIV